MKEVLGVDIGGVIMDKANDNTDTSFFGGNYLNTTSVLGTFETLRALTERFGDQIYLISKCGPKVAGKTVEWLAHHRFFERTGIPHGQVRFCKERSGKAPICDELGVTHFIDDKLEVLGYLTSVRNRFLFKPSEREIERHKQHLMGVTRVESWSEVYEKLRVYGS